MSLSWERVRKGKVSVCQCLFKTDMGTTEVGSGPEERKAPSREKKKPDPVFTKKENATIAQRIEILDGYHKHLSYQGPIGWILTSYSTLSLSARLLQ